MSSQNLKNMSELEFARFFQDIRKEILKDPIENFVKNPKLINFSPTPAQMVALKCVFGQKLDNETKHLVYVEDMGLSEGFSLTDKEYTEVELYEYMTGFEYDGNVVTAQNRINFVIGRRGGKCQAEGTDVLTPYGPKKIEEIQEGDIVYGYDSDGKVRETPVLATHYNGEKEVIELVNDQNVLAESTKDHRWLTTNWTGEQKVRRVSEFWQKDQQIRRSFVDIPCGSIHEPHAYRYAYEKMVDLSIIDTWNRESCLKFMAGLLDSDGSVYVRNDCKSLALEFGCQSKSIVEAFSYLFYKLFHKKLPIQTESRDKYKNGPQYRVRCSMNVYTKRALYQMRDYLQHPKLKWKESYADLPERQAYDTRIGVKLGKTRICRTYDLSIGNDTNLYVLANEGLITHNSTLSAIIALYSTIKVNWKPYLKKTPVATVAVLSHSVEFSQEILEILKDMVDESVILSLLRDKKRKNTQSTFHLQVPFPKKTKNGNPYVQHSRVAVKVGAASKKTTRGRAVCTLLCDEIAYWNLAENAAESDTDVLRAIRPALLQFGEHGTIIKLSSPGIKQGALYNEWLRRKELQDDYLQFKAPSWVWNTILPRDEFTKEYKLDPDGFDSEFRANFVDSISNFILPEFVDSCVLKSVKFIPPSEKKETVYTAAIDAAFKGDRFAFTLVGHNEHRITHHVLKYWEGTKQDPVKAFKVAEYARNICRQFGVREVHADQYSYQPLREIFDIYGMELVENTFSLTYKRKVYFALKKLIHNQMLDLIDDAVLHKEIKELQVEQTPTGQIRIGHPQGGSDDLSDSLAVSCYQAMEKAGTMGLTWGGRVAGRDFQKVVTDSNGRAFSAPHPEMLGSFRGFAGVVDNSSEYGIDPNTGKLRKISEMEEEEGYGSDGPDFIMA